LRLWGDLQRLAEPGFELAGLAHELNLSLAELVVGVDEGKVLLPLGDARVLLILRVENRAVGVGRGGIELNGEGVELLLGELLLKSSDLGLGAENCDRVA
jgi:hypothetical protein